MYIYLWACANLQWRCGLNSNHCPRRKGYKCSVPLNAFMTVLCTEFGIILIVNGPYISPRLDEGLIRDGWVPKIDSSFTIFLFIPPAPSGPGPPYLRGFLITHNDAPQSVGLLWTSDHLVKETSTWHHTKLTTDIHMSGGIRTPQSQQESGRRPTP